MSAIYSRMDDAYLDQFTVLMRDIPSSAYIELESQDQNIYIKYKESFLSCSMMRSLFFVSEQIRTFAGATLQNILRIPDVSKVETSPLKDYFTKVFGAKRLNRCGFSAIPVSYCTKSDIERLFVQSCEITFEDIKDLIEEIHSSTETVRHLSVEATQNLRSKIDRNSIDLLSDEQLELLFTVLIPFSDSTSLAIDEEEAKNGIALDSGKTYFGALQRVYYYEKMRRSPVTSIEWLMNTSKRLADREMPKGSVFRSDQGGYLYVFEKIHCDGAYIYLLKHLGKQGSERQNILLARGSRGTPSSTGWIESLVDDMRTELGSSGALSAYERIIPFLSRPDYGYITKQNETVRGIGMSLGGSQISRLAILLKGQIDRVQLVASPGIDKKSCESFAHFLHSDTRKKIVIDVYLEDEDIFDQFSETILGYGCSPEKALINVYILVAKESMLVDDSEPVNVVLQKLSHKRKYPKNVILALHKMSQSLLGAHCRNTSQVPHKVIHINNQAYKDIVSDILSHSGPLFDSKWEKLRTLVTFDKVLMLDAEKFSRMISQRHNTD